MANLIFAVPASASRCCLTISLNCNLGTHGPAKSDNPIINDPIINLYALPPFADHTGLVKGVQVLRHVGLRGCNLLQQFRDVFFAVTQPVYYFQPHWSRHHLKQFSGKFEHFILLHRNIRLGLDRHWRKSICSHITLLRLSKQLSNTRNLRSCKSK
jgi:hypothetical protein